MYTNNAPCSLENDFYNVNFANVKIENGIVCQALGNRNFQRVFFLRLVILILLNLDFG